MKLAVLFLFFSALVYGQEDSTKIYQIVEKVPVYKGCEEFSENSERSSCTQQKIIEHLSKNFKYPSKARKKGVQARIFVQFIVEPDVSISGIKILRGATDKYKDNAKLLPYAMELDEEAVRVTKLLEFVKPAYQNDKAVRIYYTMPINATLK